MKFKIFCEQVPEILEYKLDEFAKDNKIVNVSFETVFGHNLKILAFVQYEEKRESEIGIDFDDPEWVE